MAADMKAIQSWVEEAAAEGARWLIVACDTFDHEDYPVAVNPDEDFWEKYDHYNGKNMQRIMEVYDLEMDLSEQLKEFRAMHLPVKQ